VTTDAVKLAVTARLALRNVLRSKCDALRTLTHADGRVRGALAYYGAHTGRWAGRGTQPQNWPKDEGASDTPESATDLDSLRPHLRRCVKGPLCAVDLSQIEARGLLWCAGDTDTLALYAAGDYDPYIPAAASIFKVPESEVTRAARAAGKVTVLACGYGGGYGAVEKMCRQKRVDPESMGTSVQAMVEGWRDQNPLVAGVRTGRQWEDPEGVKPPVEIRKGGLWRACRYAFEAVASGREAERHVAGGKARYLSHPDGVLLELPSQRPILYRGVRERPKADDPESMEWCYQHPKGERTIWHGILVENLVQAMCRDLLAQAMLRLDDAGFKIVLHVHDEVLVETDDLDEVTRIMEVVPPWAEGLPIAATGSYGSRWSK
jgi:DNA polymerase